MHLLLPLVLSLLGCGTVGNAVGCDFRNGSVNGPEDRCQERSGLSSSTFAASCDALSGETVDGGCPRDGSVGECDLGTQGDGTDVIDVYYSPMTAEEAEAECGDDGTFTPA
jgi:hypothetical protein